MKDIINELEIIYCFRKFRELHKESIRNICKRYDLSVYEADVLTFLNKNPEYDLASQISFFRLLPKASVSQAIFSLLKRGLITSKRDKNDRRRLHLSITDNASEIIADLDHAENSFWSRVFSGFSDKEMDDVSALIIKLAKNLDNRQRGKT